MNKAVKIENPNLKTENPNQSQLIRNAALIEAPESIKNLPLYHRRPSKEEAVAKISNRHSISKLLKIINHRDQSQILEWEVIDSWSLKKVGYVNSISILHFLSRYKGEEGSEK